MRSTTSIRKPTHRSCEVCGRRERWGESNESWIIDTDDGEESIGDPHCIHEWDINGTFSPYQ